MEDISILTQALSLIATPMRPDGTWNRDRRACQLLAEEALRKVGYYGKSPNLGGIAAFLDAHPIKK